MEWADPLQYQWLPQLIFSKISNSAPAATQCQQCAFLPLASANISFFYLLLLCLSAYCSKNESFRFCQNTESTQCGRLCTDLKKRTEKSYKASFAFHESNFWAFILCSTRLLNPYRTSQWMPWTLWKGTCFLLTFYVKLHFRSHYY